MFWDDTHPELWAAVRIKTLKNILNVHCRAEICLYVPGIGVVVVEVSLVLQDVDEAGPGQEEADHLGQQLG